MSDEFTLFRNEGKQKRSREIAKKCSWMEW